ncbi:hypothetical protein Tco_0419102 [Tanacetum coccineum]
MDDLNITMEEYIRLEEEKAQRHGRTFNWQTATFRKFVYYEDEDDCFTDFETEFPAIVFDNTLTSDTALPCEPMVSPPNENKIDFRISLDESDDKDYTVIFDENSFSYKIIFVNDLKTDLENDNGKNNMPSSPKPTVNYLDDLDCFNDFENEFPAIVYNDGLTSKSDLLIEPPLSSQHIDKFETSLSEYDEEEQNALHFGDSFPLDVIFPDNLKTIKDSDDNIDIWRLYLLQIRDTHGSGFSYETEDGLHWGDGQQLGGVRRRMTWRQFILALGLHTKQEMAEAGDFLGPAPFYVLIRDPVRRLCHRMITYSISGRGQAPKKVTGVDLFYLRSMDRGTANVPHLLTQHLFWHAEGRKNGATLSGGHFIGRLATYFGLVSDEGLRAPGPERQQANAAGAPAAAEGAPTADRVVESSFTEQTRVSTWMISCMTQLMDASGRTYQAFDSTLVGSSRLPYQRRVRPRTSDASTSAAPRTDDQPDP